MARLLSIGVGIFGLLGVLAFFTLRSDEGRGAALFDDSPSPNLRVSLFTENNNEIGTYHRMTQDGHRLFDAAINRALSYGQASPSS